MKTKYLLLIAFLTYIVSFSQEKTLPQYFSDENGIAIHGYDVVNYHTANAAEKGSEKYAFKHDGATFYFKNKENKKAFKKNPEKYLPEYNGYCAFGMGKVKKRFPSVPTSFKIIDGKLHLFFHGPIRGKVTNTLDLWNMDETILKNEADVAWKVLQEN